MLNLNYGAMAVPPRPLLRPLCSASTANRAEQLRTELDQLHAGAENARSKANSTRVRLLRLSEVAEKLCRHAALSISNGKENDAREMLFQKKKIMEALEKSKSRIELLNELVLKLNESRHLVKKLSLTSRRGMREFMNEVKLLLKIQHKNLVMLLGCCVEGPEKMLVLTVNSRMPTIFSSTSSSISCTLDTYSCTLDPKVVLWIP